MHAYDGRESYRSCRIVYSAPEKVVAFGYGYGYGYGYGVPDQLVIMVMVMVMFNHWTCIVLLPT